MRAGDPTDHYRLLGLDPGATAARIAERLRAEHRSWQRLTSHPDLDRRQLAEQRIRDLALARATLTDPERRAAYDDELTRRAAAERAAAEREFAARAAAHREAAHREAAERRAAEHAAADRARVERAYAERHLAEQAVTTGRPSPPPVPPTPPEAPPGGPSAEPVGTVVRPRTEPP
uniref:DnaJ domain-containing protein n=1 Tax=Streptomyces bohaiensis TaxID=1431344 RepID=UPI0030C69BDE